MAVGAGDTRDGGRCGTLDLIGALLHDGAKEVGRARAAGPARSPAP
ncbi:MAG: hypothetical protein IT469_09035 [Pseudomonadales bacterium]|nr:hypothetical protein [Pseudomonadales bacterium]